MDPITRQAIAAASGSGGSDPLYVDDVFSTFLYEGTNSTNSINNGIDLSGEGGLVWIKVRDTTEWHRLFDTARGATKQLSTNTNNAQGTTNHFSSFNSNGFTVTTNDNSVNNSSYDYTAWSFRKAPGFLDIVTYTGNGTSGRTINHNLGSVPGMIIIKNYDYAGTNWTVWHRSRNSGKVLSLNYNDAEVTQNYFPSDPTATNFTVSGSDHVNSQYGFNHVAYIFAHNDESFGTDSDEAIIKCGSYNGTGSAGNSVNLGFEPQFIIVKRLTGGTGNWEIADIMRGAPARTNSGVQPFLRANSDTAEFTNYAIHPTPTGFKINNFGGGTNASGSTYIYMAIRRPHKPPTAGTQVFTAAYSRTPQSSQPPAFDSNNHVVDFGIYRRPNTTEAWYVTNRLTAPQYMNTNLTASESGSGIYYYFQHGFGVSASSDYFAYMFRRAPGFLDVVAYTGSNSSGSSSYTHNLEAVPELMIIKVRNYGGQWYVYSPVVGNSKYLRVNGNNAESTGVTWTTPTATQFTVAAGFNATHETYIAYLFATLDGISKVGSYTGTGYNINVDCGFTAGARFILIKRTDNTGDWYVWDSTRGIVSGNDPYWFLNSDAVQVTNTDYIDPLNAGFTVTSSAPAALNTSGGTYLFLAIA